ncbi:MAG: T9SS type A sorting domain-containing protein [Lewinella sp.]|nr:T9SS type A sorting domain-containing protein [Lewinella sp.]
MKTKTLPTRSTEPHAPVQARAGQKRRFRTDLLTFTRRLPALFLLLGLATAAWGQTQLGGNDPDRPDVPTDNSVTTSHLQAYPNPTTGAVTVNLAGYLEQSATLEVVNTFGQLIVQRRLGVIESGTEQVDLSAQPAGVYLLRLRLDDGRTEMVQLVKQ